MASKRVQGFAPLKSEIIYSDTNEAVYSDDAVLKSPHLKGKANLSIYQAAQVLSSILYRDVKNKLSPYIILHLAMDLETTDSLKGDQRVPERLGSGLDWPAIRIMNENLAPQNVVISSGIRSLRKKTQASTSKAPANPFGDEEEEDENQSMIQVSNGTEYEKSAKFVSAFLLRLLVKNVTNVTNAWSQMQKRYENFYNEEIDSVFSECPGEEVLTDLKTKLTSNPAIATTWIISLYSNKSRNAERSLVDTNMLRYLVVLPLQYAGMHAVKLFLTYKNASKCDAIWLLNSLRSPAHNAALKDIYIMLESWFPVKGDPKTGMFRFSRLVNPNFFPNVQTRQCPSLVYVLSHCIMEYTLVPGRESLGSIAGMENVSGKIKEQMEEAAKMLYESTPESQEDDYSEIMKKSIIGKGKKKEEEPKPRRSLFGRT
uniref:Nucleoprotein n=1 Tax=Aristolochia-associated cytorhabdovirus TaxID=3071548 RepID=A0AA50LSE6_9RHAB|nr:nucleocapsid [Aristolochia-associated cytorhabdovirus]